MKYVFFGTAEFSQIVLGSLIDAGFPPAALVCNPDRPVGRKKVITPPPTKQLVQKLRIKVFQPENRSELLAISGELFAEADFGVVAAYSQIIPDEIIKKAKRGIVGVHPSLLPKFRGAAPIQSAILSGEQKTGVTLFFIDENVDHGPILASRELKIKSQNYEELMRELAELGGGLLVDTLPKLNDIQTTIQDESEATYTEKFKTEDGLVEPDYLERAESGDEEVPTAVLRKIRALNPEPGVYTFMDSKRTKLLGAKIEDGKLVLTRIQKEGKTPVDV